jgi:hypothetical protein
MTDHVHDWVRSDMKDGSVIILCRRCGRRQP